MIVRVQSLGQYRLDSGPIARLQDLDTQLVSAVGATTEEKVHELLGQIVALVRAQGRPVGLDELVPSDLVLPAPDATLEEVRAVLREDGLIPG
ncbi:MAG: hypothetical protein NVSMB65_07710 [Chloroflexota bacterium]